MAQRKPRRDEETGLWLVDGSEDVPQFATDEEEAAFWDTHDFSEEFWKGATRVPPEHLAAGRAAGPGSGAGSQPVARPDGAPAAESQGFPLVFAAGVIVGGALVLGAAYLLFELMKAGTPAKDFLPTKARHLRISA